MDLQPPNSRPCLCLLCHPSPPNTQLLPAPKGLGGDGEACPWLSLEYLTPSGQQRGWRRVGEWQLPVLSSNWGVWLPTVASAQRGARARSHPAAWHQPGQGSAPGCPGYAPASAPQRWLWSRSSRHLGPVLQDSSPRLSRGCHRGRPGEWRPRSEHSGTRGPQTHSAEPQPSPGLGVLTQLPPTRTTGHSPAELSCTIPATSQREAFRDQHPQGCVKGSTQSIPPFSLSVRIFSGASLLD